MSIYYLLSFLMSYLLVFLSLLLKQYKYLNESQEYQVVITKSSFNEIVWISKYSKHFDFVGCEVECPSERVDAFSSGVNVTMTTSEIGVASGVLMRVVCYVDIM